MPSVPLTEQVNPQGSEKRGSWQELSALVIMGRVKTEAEHTVISVSVFPNEGAEAKPEPRTSSGQVLGLPVALGSEVNMWRLDPQWGRREVSSSLIQGHDCKALGPCPGERHIIITHSETHPCPLPGSAAPLLIWMGVGVGMFDLSPLSCCSFILLERGSSGQQDTPGLVSALVRVWLVGAPTLWNDCQP